MDTGNPMDETTKALHSSVLRLQKWNWVLLGSVVILALVLIAGRASESGIVRAQSIQLISEDGRVLAELSGQDGNAGLYLKDSEGMNRAAFFHAVDATGLYIMDSDGVTRVGIAQFAHGGGGVALHGQDSKGAAVLYLKGEGSLRFFDSEGEVTNQVTARREEETE